MGYLRERVTKENTEPYVGVLSFLWALPFVLAFALRLVLFGIPDTAVAVFQKMMNANYRGGWASLTLRFFQLLRSLYGYSVRA